MHDITREDIRNAASTLAHHWAQGVSNREGVRRLLVAYPPAVRTILSALILERLVTSYTNEAATMFDNLLFDMADIEECL